MASILVAAGLGVVSSTLFMGHMPDSPVTGMALYEYVGLPSKEVHTVDGSGLEQPHMQVLARGPTNGYAAARAQIEAAYGVLSRVQNRTINGRWYVSVRPLQPPFSLGLDANQRVQCVCNFSIVRAAG
jgi:hypothetical protein